MSKIISKLTMSMNTRKLSKVLSMVSKHTQTIADDLEEMDLKGCPECGSFDYRIEHEVDGKDNHYNVVICTECGFEYTRYNDVVDLLYRK